LPRSWFAQGALALAPKLLGQLLCCDTEEGAAVGRIVEVEAYVGPHDRAAHSFADRPSTRTRVQYDAGGKAYNYLIYGMYVCFNITCAPPGHPQCVLVRALEPLAGEPLMRSRCRSGQTVRTHTLCQGPGKLTRALGIGMQHYGVDLLDPESGVRLERGKLVQPAQVLATPRINVGYAGDDALRPWRFFVAGSPAVSGRKSFNADAVPLLALTGEAFAIEGRAVGAKRHT